MICSCRAADFDAGSGRGVGGVVEVVSCDWSSMLETHDSSESQGPLWTATVQKMDSLQFLRCRPSFQASSDPVRPYQYSSRVFSNWDRYARVREFRKAARNEVKKDFEFWCNLYNVDEIGVQLGGGRNGASNELFFYSERDQNRYKLKSDDLELITVLETACADGTAPIKPCFVFKGKLFCQEWSTVDPEILTATTDTGWTNDEIYKTWFKNSFLPPRPTPILTSPSFSSTMDMVPTALFLSSTMVSLPAMLGSVFRKRNYTFESETNMYMEAVAKSLKCVYDAADPTSTYLF
ncbi:hypothetical protein VKT23_013854 [Stygiomarasmius scandens]|uniref:DDE-1 domain-containing protein n=1 Tax=Marasmiellus scandens TaxID=2682957 RepID=A0ABR1J6Q6_9AGAR